MSSSRRAAVLVAGAILLVAIVGFLIWQAVDDGSTTGPGGIPSGTAAVASALTDADPPFDALTAGTITVGGRALDVVVADREDERIQGLRGRADASPYAGMLFVFDGATTTGFTMAGVPAPLRIAFFDDAGRRVDELRMEPCAGTDATCPVYESSAPYRYTLETAPDEMPSGKLRVAGSR